MKRLLLLICLMSIPAILPVSLGAAAPDSSATDPPKQQTAKYAHIVLKGSYPEGAQPAGLFGEVIESLQTARDRLQKAASDDEIRGVVLEIRSPTLGWGKLYEMRQAIHGVRCSGKKVYAYCESADTRDYLLATACDEIIMPESGMVMLLGLRAEVSFYKNLFDKLDVKAEMLRVGEFKSAAEPYTRTEMSEPFRRQMEEMLDDYYRQLTELVAKGRKLEVAAVEQAIDNGPYSASDAKERGLIDHVAYDDELEKLLAKGQPAGEVKITKNYGKKKREEIDFNSPFAMFKLMNILMGVDQKKSGSSKPKIAIIHAQGMIFTGKSTSSLFAGDVMGSDTIVKAIRKAGDDKTVKAIVLRVDSPGGSALASDLMWRALQQVDKPVVVSMGNVAASGGYYISMGADRIFAEPGTLTGSIGVVGGKLALKGLFEKVGITTTVISRGKNSGILSPHEGFTESERKAMQKMLDDIYGQFTKKAASGRKMEHDALEKLARGRVYTGAMAKEIGLVDELGTLEDAVQHAQKLAGLDADDKPERMILPPAPNPFESLFGPTDVGATGAEQQAGKNLLSEALRSISPEAARHLQAIDLINVLAREPRLVVMPFQLRVR